MNRKEILRKREEAHRLIDQLTAVGLDPKTPYEKGIEIINKRNELKKRYVFYKELLKRC